MPDEPGVPAHLVGRDDGIETMSDVEMVHPKTGQRVTFGEWRAGELREAEASRKLAAALEAQEAEPQEIIPRGRTVLGGGATRRSAPVRESAVDRVLERHGMQDPNPSTRRAREMVPELWAKLHAMNAGDPELPKTRELYAAAVRDSYPDDDSGTWDMDETTPQHVILEAEQRRDAEQASRRDFGPDYKPPVVHTAAGPLTLDESIHYSLHDYAMSKGISQELTDMHIRAFVSGAAQNEPAASYAELESLWGPANGEHYKTSFARAQREAAALVARLPASSRKQVEPWLRNPSARVWALLADLGTPPAQRRVRTSGHVAGGMYR